MERSQLKNLITILYGENFVEDDTSEVITALIDNKEQLKKCIQESDDGNGWFSASVWGSIAKKSCFLLTLLQNKEQWQYDLYQKFYQMF